MLDSKIVVRFTVVLVQIVRTAFRSRADLALENLALRQQVVALKRPPVRSLAAPRTRTR